MAPPPLKVDPERLRAIADSTDAVADGVRRVESTVAACGPQGADLFGTSRVADAFRRFHDRWSAELHVTNGAASQLADGLRRAAGGYRAADDDAAHRFR
jgi:hypothetical protein